MNNEQLNIEIDRLEKERIKKLIVIKKGQESITELKRQCMELEKQCKETKRTILRLKLQ